MWLAISITSTMAVSSAQAGDCGCQKVSAESYSDSGTCVVRESDPAFCTLDWRHGDDTPADDPQETGRADGLSRQFIDKAISDPRFGMFSDPNLWGSLGQVTPNATSAYKAAATYLETVRPTEYQRDPALASFAAIIGSLTGQDERATFLLLGYLATSPDVVFDRLRGKDVPEPRNQQLGDGSVLDFSSYGCLELRYVPEKAEVFSLRVAARSIFAEGGTCARRPQ
jgi:hypothetical protein